MHSPATQHSPFASYARPAPDYLAGIASLLAQIALVGYLFQTALFAPVRYILAAAKLEPLWYLPDGFGLMCLAAVLVVDARGRNYRILIFLFALTMYALEGYFVSGSAASVLSTFKALVPLFCGLLLDRDMLTRPLMRAALFMFWAAACGGVVYSTFGTAPWTKLQFQGVGVAQAYKAMQWTTQGDVRNFGFAGDQHGAASSILTLFIFLSLRPRRLLTFYLLGSVSLVMIYLTTSRSNLLAFLVFVGLYSVSDLRKRTSQQNILRWSLEASSLAMLVPAAVIGISLWYTSADVPKQLLSLWIRGNETWLAPFRFIDDLAPFAILSGFGLGGMGFGLLQSDIPQYYSTVDSFILFNFLTFGTPFLVFYVYQCRRMLFEPDPHRAMAFIVTALSGLLLRGWSDYLFMILFGYGAVCVFRGVPTAIGQTVVRRTRPGSLRLRTREA
jgi:hypothetical protein